MLKITNMLVIPEKDLNFSFIKSSGPGGQNVNKVATAVLLRFDIMKADYLSKTIRANLIKLAGTKITIDGVINIKASRYRTQERNRQDAVDRLRNLLFQASLIPKKRKKTKPTLASKELRLKKKKLLSKTKAARQGKWE